MPLPLLSHVRRPAATNTRPCELEPHPARVILPPSQDSSGDATETALRAASTPAEEVRQRQEEEEEEDDDWPDEEDLIPLWKRRQQWKGCERFDRKTIHPDLAFFDLPNFDDLEDDETIKCASIKCACCAAHRAFKYTPKHGVQHLKHHLDKHHPVLLKRWHAHLDSLTNKAREADGEGDGEGAEADGEGAEAQPSKRKRPCRVTDSFAPIGQLSDDSPKHKLFVRVLVLCFVVRRVALSLKRAIFETRDIVITARYCYHY